MFNKILYVVADTDIPQLGFCNQDFDSFIEIKSSSVLLHRPLIFW
jgi:hypothetical protein